jgi:hypothetical protein
MVTHWSWVVALLSQGKNLPVRIWSQLLPADPRNLSTILILYNGQVTGPRVVLVAGWYE